jgi:hypothetical protein
MQFGLGALASGLGEFNLGFNTYYNAGFKYVATNGASLYSQNGSTHRFFTAPSGTAGNAITFTQAMTLDASGNLGIGTSSPTVIGGYIAQTINGTSGSFTEYRENNSNTLRVGTDGGNGGFVFTQSTLPVRFGTNGVERVRITSTGLVGIGTSAPTSNGGSAAGLVHIHGAASGAWAINHYTNGTTGANAADGLIVGSIGADAYIYNYENSPIIFATNSAERMRLDSSGNLGIGTSSPAQRLDVTGAGNSVQARFGAVAGRGLTIGTAVIAGTNDAGVIFNAPITEGTLIFQTNSTERARITSGGALLVGATSNFGAADDRLQVDTATASARSGIFRNNTSTTDTVGVWNSATTGDNLFIQFYTEAGASVRGSITYNRAGGLVAYNVTSDYRAKDIIGPVQDSGAIIDALKVYEGQMKGATQSRPMLIAHEAQEHAPYAVTGEKDAVNEDGTPKYQQMDVSALVPLLLAEIQSLRARVAQLETK